MAIAGPSAEPIFSFVSRKLGTKPCDAAEPLRVNSIPNANAAALVSLNTLLKGGVVQVAKRAKH
jgi:hypothetical protein